MQVTKVNILLQKGDHLIGVPIESIHEALEQLRIVALLWQAQAEGDLERELR